MPTAALLTARKLVSEASPMLNAWVCGSCSVNVLGCTMCRTPM